MIHQNAIRALAVHLAPNNVRVNNRGSVIPAPDGGAYVECFLFIPAEKIQAWITQPDEDGIDVKRAAGD